MDGDWFTRCGHCHLHWGRHGAAGLLAASAGQVLLQQRAGPASGAGTWGLFGGARHSDEDPVTAALRETAEESTLPIDEVRVHGIATEDHGDWAYHTVFGTVPEPVAVRPASWETAAAAWVPEDEVARWSLFEPFGNAWPRLRPGLRRPVLVVDCANVMGARADGWWRDRAGAAGRLRDDLGEVARCGTTGIDPFDRCLPEVVLVVEGAARGIGPGETGVRVVDAPRVGDDAIVEQVELAGPDTRPIVVTADRALRERCRVAGAAVLGPRWLLDRLG
ncbi:MAG TPA: NUDIX domain-containing protein [Actinophytocola sp.]|uniref:NUDIX domain-containing protein n=1 Tax=Actinophytocola sp. TaxID=1872138 RepID=UPI002DB9F422|nr:NUDIX domain-containing protein [Actinophytocola sp.]HEU5475973.1 NUDIX domain-containing protein [Actinophytocola sp.]